MPVKKPPQKKAPVKKTPVKKTLPLEEKEESVKTPQLEEVTRTGTTEPDVSAKQGCKATTIVAGQRRVGMSKGITVNLGDYQSARLDCWMEAVVEDDKRIIDTTIGQLSAEIEAYLESEVRKLKE